MASAATIAYTIIIKKLDRFRLLEGVTVLLAELARAAPLLLVLEDLHWAHRATLAVLVHLARSPKQAALLVLVTCRTGGLGAGDAWAETLAEPSSNSASPRGCARYWPAAWRACPPPPSSCSR